LCVNVLLEYPQVQACPAPDNGGGRQRQELRADATALVVASDVQIVKQRSPLRIVLEHGVGERDQLAAILREEGMAARIGRGQPMTPRLHTIGNNVAVEKLIRVRPAIVATPAVGVKPSHRLGVRRSCQAELQIANV
jgi:hypothetical protein